MPRKKVKVRDHDRRKPHQEVLTHVDKYTREQDLRSREPPGPEEIGPDNSLRECEAPGCKVVRKTTDMVQLLDGSWFCKTCAEGMPKDIDEEVEQIEAIETDLHGSNSDTGWRKRGMKLLTQADRKKLPKLYETEKVPVEDKVLRVKFFTPTSNWTWYATEFDGEDMFFGYVEGRENEWGYFSLKELSEVKGPYGVGIERDKYWEPIKFGEYIAKKGG